MTNSFWWILLSLALYGVIHSILAGLSVKNLVRKWIGDTAYHRYYRLFFSVQAGVLFIPSLVLTAVLPNQFIYQIPRPLLYLTIFIQGVSVFILVHTVMLTGAFRFIGLRQLIDPADAKQSLPLVVRGMYKYVRHPLYTFSLLFIWLTPIMSWNVLALNIGITLYMLIGAIFEEKKLLLEFGEAYAIYKEKTAFILPFLKMR